MTHPPEDRTGSEVQDWLDEVGEAPPGDFCDVLRRTQGLEGARVSAQDIEDASHLPADEDELRARVNFGSLDDFLDAAAAFVAAQAIEEPPPMREPVPRRRGWVWVAASTAAVAAAAAVLVWWSVPRDALVPRANEPAVAAASERSDRDAEAQAAKQRPASHHLARPTPEPNPEPAQRDEPQTAPEVPDSAPSGAPRTPQRPSIEALDAQAREAWRAGELDRARRLFERVVSRGRGGERADVAYGDLFTLARRQGDDAALRRYWKRYVKRFPTGRYIDDARAGLCRAASGDARTRCWERYLEARPRGTYRGDAEAALRAP